MPGGKLPRIDTELVILRVAAVRGSDYEFDHHTLLGRRAGLADADIERVRARVRTPPAGTTASPCCCA